MSTARRVLILRTGPESSDGISAVVESLAGQGASVVVRRCEGDYEALLDEIAQADTVLCWE